MYLEEMQTRLTFVVGAVHFDHHVIQLLLLQHADALKNRESDVTRTAVLQKLLGAIQFKLHTY